MIRQKMDSLSFELLSRMAHMMTRMTRMTHWLDSHDSLARWLAVCQDPRKMMSLYNNMTNVHTMYTKNKNEECRMRKNIN